MAVGSYLWYDRVYRLGSGLHVSSIILLGLIPLTASLLIAIYRWLIGMVINHESYKPQPAKAKPSAAVRFARWLARIHNRAFRDPYQQS